MTGRLPSIGLALLLATATVSTHGQFDVMDELPVAEQYRQLSLLLLVTAGARPGLTEALDTGPSLSTDDGEAGFDPSAYTTPLVRIVDQESLLAGVARLFRLADANRAEIRARLERLETDYPYLISRLATDAITADAVIVRNAVADSAEYSGLLTGEGLQEGIQAYRAQTVYLRNVLEYEDFRMQLDRLTAEAIESVGGKLDAYQRMFDDETGSATFDRHIEAAESIYARKGAFDPDAGKLTEEMINNWILSESQPNR